MFPLETSVVVITKNNINTIGKCLCSLMPYHKQGYISEVIVVDAHSTDGTLEILENYPVRLTHDEGKARAAAYDIGWRIAHGEIVIFLDADAYLGEAFFPDIYEFFSDERVGVGGCQPKAPAMNRIAKAEAELWCWMMEVRSPSSSRFKRLYAKMSLGGNPELPGGPCQVVRRVCLEEVGGFPHYPHTEDIYLSQKIIDKGWKPVWWIKAPLYHYPRSTLRELVKNQFHYGRSFRQSDIISSCERGRKFTNSSFLLLISRMISPLLATYFALHFRNPMHLIVYPVPRYAWVVGYLSEKVTTG